MAVYADQSTFTSAFLDGKLTISDFNMLLVDEVEYNIDKVEVAANSIIVCLKGDDSQTARLTFSSQRGCLVPSNVSFGTQHEVPDETSEEDIVVEEAEVCELTEHVAMYAGQQLNVKICTESTEAELFSPRIVLADDGTTATAMLSEAVVRLAVNEDQECMLHNVILTTLDDTKISIRAKMSTGPCPLLVIPAATIQTHLTHPSS